MNTEIAPHGRIAVREAAPDVLCMGHFVRIDKAAGRNLQAAFLGFLEFFMFMVVVIAVMIMPVAVGVAVMVPMIVVIVFGCNLLAAGAP